MSGPRTAALLLLALVVALAAGLWVLCGPSAEPPPPGDTNGSRALPEGTSEAGARLRGRPQPPPSTRGSGETQEGLSVPSDAAASDAHRAFFDDAFRLRVVDPAGEGVPGAALQIRAHGRRGPVVTAPHADWATGSSRTDATGRVEVRGGNLAGGVVTISFLDVPDDLALPGPMRMEVTGEEAVIRLGRAAQIGGRVLFDPSRPPPEGVDVEARWHAEGAPCSRRVRAGDDGAFTVGGIPPGATLDLFAYPRYPVPSGVVFGRARPAGDRVLVVPGSSPLAAGAAWNVPAGTRGIEIPLGGPPDLDVRVVDDRGAPLAPPLWLSPVGSTQEQPLHVLAEDGGRLVVNALRPGRYRLDPLRPTLGVAEFQVPYGRETIVVPAASSRNVRGQLIGSGDLRGFRVEVRSPLVERPRVVLTDEGGAFAASAPGGLLSFRATRFGDPRSGGLRDVPEGRREVEILLDYGLEIRGVVLDVNGAPIAFEGWVRAEGASVVETTPVLLGGRFAFQGLPRGAYTLRVGGDGPTSEASLPDVDAGSLDVTIRLGSTR